MFMFMFLFLNFYASGFSIIMKEPVTFPGVSFSVSSWKWLVVDNWSKKQTRNLLKCQADHTDSKVADYFSFYVSIRNKKLDVEKHISNSWRNLFLILGGKTQHRRSSHRTCSIKKFFLKISQENGCARVSISIKLQDWDLQNF